MLEPAQSTWEAFRDATYSAGNAGDGFIELPTDVVNFKNKNPLEKSIYVREEYIRLFDKIWNDIDNKVWRYFVVTGAPGIGKSMFAYYFIWRYLHDAKYRRAADGGERSIYFQINSRSVLHFEGNRTVSLNLAQAEDELTSIKGDRAIVLTDVNEHMEPLGCGWVNIVLVSPNPTRYKEFLKLDFTTMYFMNPWSLDELKTVRQKLYSEKLTLAAVEKAHHLCGGVARFVFKKNSEAEVYIKLALDKFIGSKNRLAEIVYVSGAHDDQISYALFHHTSPDNTLAAVEMRFASEYVIDRIFDGIKKETFNDAFDFISKSSVGYMQSVVGVVFERRVHYLICGEGLPELRRLQPTASRTSNAKKDRNKSTLKSEKLNELNIETLDPIAFNNKEAPEMYANISTLSRVDKGVYFRPYSLTEASLDSFAIIGNRVFAFQVTVGQNHAVKAKGLVALQKCVETNWPEERFEYHLVFICPKGKISTEQFTAQTITCTDKVEKKSGLLFKDNRWVAEIDLPNDVQRLLDKLEAKKQTK